MKQTIIYIRTSTEEQNPENQLKDCEALVTKLDLNDYEVLEEKESAWKDNVQREIFNSIKKSIEHNQIKNLLCWDLDRLFRNRKKLMQFFELCKIYNCKIYSVRQEWLEGINNIQEPFNEIVHNLMIQVMGWLAEEESQKKSDRVKSAVRKNKEGTTISYKKNKWGRKTIITKKLIESCKKLKEQGLDHRKIAEQVYYYDKNNNKKKISPSLVYKLLKENPEKVKEKN